ncbi:MAG: hypothetical protein JKY48_12620 [Flavobacteriales bacterium]|nr:hypothetical protein [Flavobacteriales bacterium]
MMNWDAIGAVAESLGAIGVILTLIYLAMQIRQNTESSLTTAEVSFVNEFVAWHARVTAQPELGEIWDAALENPDALSKEQARRFIWLLAEFFLIIEGQYKLYQKNRLTADSWQAKLNVIQGLLGNSLVEQWWLSRATPFGMEFINYVNSLEKAKQSSWSPQVIANIANSDSEAHR